MTFLYVLFDFLVLLFLGFFVYWDFYIPEFHCHLLIDDSICNGIRDKVNTQTKHKNIQ